MNHGFAKIATAIPSVQVADCSYNTDHIQSLVAQAEGQGVEILCFPELSLTAYSCRDLFLQSTLVEEAEMSLVRLLDFARGLDIICIVGIPVAFQGVLLNCAAVIQRGQILGLVPKTFLTPEEKRTFTSLLDIPEGEVLLCGKQVHIAQHTLFHTPSCTFAIEIGADALAPLSPATKLTSMGADIIFCPAAYMRLVEARENLCHSILSQSQRLLCGYVFSSCGQGESTQDGVFEGSGWIYEMGTLLASSLTETRDEQLIISEIDIENIHQQRRRSALYGVSLCKEQPYHVSTEDIYSNDAWRGHSLLRHIDSHPFLPTGCNEAMRCNTIFRTQVEGLARRIQHTHSDTLVIGISGGLDSTLALLVCARTCDLLGMDRKKIVAITMPGFGTTDRTYTNALTLMERLGTTAREISIREACIQHFSDILHNPDLHNTTYENAQARERTQILMDIANQAGGLVVGTGDLSELALGWATYNGDHMSMYGVNAGVPKTLIPHIIRWASSQFADEAIEDILLDIIDTPISPELTPPDAEGHIAQKTEDLVGPYELHDFYLYYTLHCGFRPSKIFFLAQQAFHKQYDDETLLKWLHNFFRRFFQQQFKRSCLPDGPKVGSCSLSPRGDWAMPTDAVAKVWLQEIEEMMKKC